jgi:hypothetical protein
MLPDSCEVEVKYTWYYNILEFSLQHKFKETDSNYDSKYSLLQTLQQELLLLFYYYYLNRTWLQ